MGWVKVTGRIGLDAGDRQELGFLVKTASFYMMSPSSLALEAGITYLVSSKVTLADSRKVEVDVGLAFLRLDGREGGGIVASMNVPMPLLGASALDALGFKVDPVTETLEATRPIGPSVLTGET